VPSGSAIDTTTVGDHAFTVSASDNAGNASSRTVHYTVAAAKLSGAPATQPPANQPLAPASQPSAPASAVLGVLSHRRVKAKGKWALITLKCVGISGQTCAGNIRLRPTALRSRLQSAASSGSRRTFRIAAGSSRTLRVALASASRTQLKHRRKSVAMAVITLAGGGAPLVRHMLVTVFPG
jgi:hypothetical protein